MVDHDETQNTKKHSSPTRALKSAGFILIILAVGLLLGFLLSSLGGKDIKTKLTDATQGQNLEYDLYYPTNIPAGYEVEDETIAAAEIATSITLLNNKSGNRLIMTQQKRPSLMEEVNKIREFDTNLGKAYIADLNGRTAGFILASDTLIIINSSGQIDLNVLRQFMESITKA